MINLENKGGDFNPPCYHSRANGNPVIHLSLATPYKVSRSLLP